MSGKKIFIKLVFCFFLCFFLSFSLICFSAEEEAARELEIDYPEIQGIQPETVSTGLPEYVSYVFNLGIVIAILILFGSLVYGGVLYLISVGQVAKLMAAKERISAAFLGIIIILSSYVILTTINPELVVFRFEPLRLLEKPVFDFLKLLDKEETNFILRELPLGQAVENGIWEQERTAGIKEIFEDFDKFLKKEIKIKDVKKKGIADLNKYLKYLTEDCRCGELKPLCTDFTEGTEPIGCVGDPCPKDVRERINLILEINSQNMKELLRFKEKISEEKKKLEIELSRFAEIEQEILACQSEIKGIYSLNEYLSIKQFYEEQGVEVTVLPSYLESRGDPLTFYCPLGGSIFDIPVGESVSYEVEMSSEFTFGSVSCPVEFPVGEVIDQSRELAILLSVKMEQATYLIEETMKEIRKMTDLVSYCNGKNCKVICQEIPNPCNMPAWKCAALCATIIVAPSPESIVCCLTCQSEGVQGVGVCYGRACEDEWGNDVRPKIGETVEKLKEKYEDEIFALLKEIKQIFPRVDFLLRAQENPLNLQNVKAGVGFCYGSYSEAGLMPDWQLLNCQAAVGNYGPNNLIIGSCHPRNFFCCTFSQTESLVFPSIFRERPSFILMPKKYEALPSEDNCPQGWDCNPDVKKYNQYEDASEPLKELLACMRGELDKVQKEKGVEKTLGRITSISDSKIYLGTCSWESGPQTVGGCSHTYTIKDGKEAVSSHYGGPSCRYQRASYAVDIGVSELHEKKYAYEIIAAAKKCFPSAFILYLVPGHYDHIHISIGAAYYCGSN
jgi:hypothetical protein